MKQPTQLSKQVVNSLKQGGVVSASLFGSLARGETTKQSDIDLLVRYSDDVSLFDVTKLRQVLKQQTGREVDLVPEDAIHPGLYRRIKAELVKIF